jgi:hypothetical protein
MAGARMFLTLHAELAKRGVPSALSKRAWPYATCCALILFALADYYNHICQVNRNGALVQLTQRKGHT